MKIVFFFGSRKQVRAFNTLLQEKGMFDSKSYWVSIDSSWAAEYRQAVIAADIVLFGAEPVSVGPLFMAGLRKTLQESATPFVMLHSGHLGWETEWSSTCETPLKEYYRYGGKVNRENLLAVLETKNHEIIPKAQPVPLIGVYRPGQEPIALSDYCHRELENDKRLRIVYLFHREQWLAGETEVMDALLAETERQGALGIAVFCQFGALPELHYEGVAGLFREIKSESLGIDAVVTLQQQSMTGMAGFSLTSVLDANIPILQAYTLYTTEAEWDSNPDGMGVTELGTQVILPEADGVLHTLPVAALDPTRLEERAYIPVCERIEKTVRKAVKWGRLKHIKNADKKIVIVLHNYPPKNSNIGTAAGLDSPESLYRLLCNLREQGYVVDGLPGSSKALMTMILAAATNDRRYISDHQIETAVGKMKDGEYIRFFRTLPLKTTVRMEEDWGEAPGEVFHYDDFLLIPGIAMGNVFVTVQPPRGFGENMSAIYHSPDLTPPHHYLAFYQWLRDNWKADAVVHLGTHGSMEWLPGKGTGLSESCYPDLSLRELPDVYPYWITIVGEGIQAKRRGSACLIGHLSPPQTQAGLYGQYDTLRRLLDEYNTMKIQGGISEELTGKIRETVAALELLPEEVYQGEVEDWAEQVHERLDDLTYLQIRTGLHILGQVPQRDELNNFLAMLTEVANGDVPSLPETLYGALCKSTEATPEEQRAAKARAYELKSRFIELIALAHYLCPSRETIEQWLLKEDVDTEIAKDLFSIAVYVTDFLVPALAKTDSEITNTLRALQGEYIEPSLGGAPTSGCADILPTGRNFTSADPNSFPTENAYSLGITLAEQALEKFIAEEKIYPESIGIILWATAQMRSYGQCLGEILYFLGLKPIWQAGSGRITDLEVIPVEKLGRPRIDVTARISGLFRDTMPMSASLIEKAVNLVADLPESPEVNYIRKHIQEDVELWVAEGSTKEEAFKEARWRVFGDPPGAYGAGIGKVLEAKNWENDDDLAKVYTAWSGYAFRSEGHAIDGKRAFTRRLSEIRLTIQNADNRESHLLNSDDYNAYHGGMNVTVRALTGKAPMSIMGDTSRRNKATTRTIAEEAERLVRGEALNPKYIEGMKKHGYKGAQDMAGYVSHLYQWDATTSVATDWMYERIAETYALDPAMREWFKDVNPWALERLTEVLLEAIQRGLWQTTDERRQELAEILLETEGDLEEYGDNPSAAR